MSGNKSREKGKRGERRACQVMEDITGVKWRRTSQVRGGVSGAPDIEAEGFAWLHVEVKACAKHRLSDVLGELPVAVDVDVTDGACTATNYVCYPSDSAYGSRHRIYNAVYHPDSRLCGWLSQCRADAVGGYWLLLVLPDRRVPLLVAPVDVFNRLGIGCR